MSALDSDGSSTVIGLTIFFIVVSLLFSSVISACEAALASLPRTRLQKRADDGDSKAQALMALLDDPQQLLLTLMVCDWLADVTFLVLVSWLVFHYIVTWPALVVLIFAMTVVLLIVGEILPKVYASKRVDPFVYQSVPFVKTLLLICRLPVWLLRSMFSETFLEGLGNFRQLASDFTEDEIIQMVNLSSQTGMLEKEESELLESALTFDDKLVSAVLTPRVDMVCVENNYSLDDALKLMIDEGYSRLPVYKENLDNIIGLVHIKDLLKEKQDEPEHAGYPVEAFVRDVYHVHEHQRINEVLKSMQTRHQPMFIVTDEYGGTAGLITIEDLLEEIVGEILDEHDQEEEPPLVEIDAQTILVDGKISVNEVNSHLDLALPNGQSVAGLVFSTLGEVPQEGQILTIEDALLTVDAIDGIRIQRVRIQKLSPDGQSETDTINSQLIEKSQSSA